MDTANTPQTIDVGHAKTLAVDTTERTTRECGLAAERQAPMRDRIIATRERYDAMVASRDAFAARCQASQARYVVVRIDGAVTGQWALDADPSIPVDLHHVYRAMGAN